MCLDNQMATAWSPIVEGVHNYDPLCGLGFLKMSISSPVVPQIIVFLMKLSGIKNCFVW